MALYGAESWTLNKVRRLEITGEFGNVALEKDGEDQLDGSCER